MHHLYQIAEFIVCSYLLAAFITESRVYTGGNTVKINTEAAGCDINEYHPSKPIAGVFGLLF